MHVYAHTEEINIRNFQIGYFSAASVIKMVAIAAIIVSHYRRHHRRHNHLKMFLSAAIFNIRWIIFFGTERQKYFVVIKHSHKFESFFILQFILFSAAHVNLML